MGVAEPRAERTFDEDMHHNARKQRDKHATKRGHAGQSKRRKQVVR